MNFKKFPFKNILPITAFVIFGVFLIYFFLYFFNYHYHIITCPYPQDVSEGLNMLPTELLLQGKNPFDLSNNPQYTNIYGIFYSLVAFPFAKIWGNTLLVHHIVVGFFIFACCLLIVTILRKDKLPWVLCCAGGMTLYPFLIFPYTTTEFAGPNGLGLFLFLLTFFVPYLLNYSKTSLCLSILFGLLAFYTKLYFFLGIPFTALYIFLFKSKKAGILYGLFFSLLFAPSVYIAHSLMNCYFNNVLFVEFNNVSSGSNAAHAIAELTRFYQLQKPLFLLSCVYLIVHGVLYIKNLKNAPSKNFFSKINIFNWRPPAFNWNFNIYLYGFIMTSLTVYFTLGRNTQQFAEYMFQLMSPFFILFIFHVLNKHRFITFLSIPLIIMTLFTVSSNFNKNFHEFDKSWAIVDSLVASNKNIFANPLLVPLLIKYHRPVYDSGNSEYFKLGADRNLSGLEFPAAPEIMKKTTDYMRQIWAQTSQKKFDLMIMYPDYHPFMLNLCYFYYRPLGKITLGSIDSTYLFNFVVLVPR